jgi:hypothetical protein
VGKRCAASFGSAREATMTPTRMSAPPAICVSRIGSRSKIAAATTPTSGMSVVQDATRQALR